MELYRRLIEIRCFTHKDMVRLTGSETAAQWQIKNYIQKDISNGSAEICTEL